MVKVRLDRYALAEIVSDKSILEVLLQTTFSIKGTTNTDLLLDRILDRIFALMPAERGAVLFSSRKPGALDCAAFRGSSPDVDLDIATEAMSDYTAFLSDGDVG